MGWAYKSMYIHMLTAGRATLKLNETSPEPTGRQRNGVQKISTMGVNLVVGLATLESSTRTSQVGPSLLNVVDLACYRISTVSSSPLQTTSLENLYYNSRESPRLNYYENGSRQERERKGPSPASSTSPNWLRQQDKKCAQRRQQAH